MSVSLGSANLTGRAFFVAVIWGCATTLAGCGVVPSAPLAAGYVTLEQGQVVVKSLCGDDLLEVGAGPDDPSGNYEAKWHVVAEGAPKGSVALNVDNVGYRTLGRWKTPLPEHFAVNFKRVGTIDLAFAVDASRLNEGVALTELGEFPIEKAVGNRTLFGPNTCH